MSYDDHFISPAMEETLKECKQQALEEITQSTDFIEILEQLDESEIKEVMEAYVKGEFADIGLLIYRAIDNTLEIEAKERMVAIYE